MRLLLLSSHPSELLNKTCFTTTGLKTRLPHWAEPVSGPVLTEYEGVR